MGITIDFDTRKIAAKIEGQSHKAEFALGSQVLKDSNLYCKEDAGTLKESAIVNSSNDLTTVQWTEPYAALQYKLLATRLDKNPLASPEWFEKAKDAYLSDWINIYEKVLKE